MQKDNFLEHPLPNSNVAYLTPEQADVLRQSGINIPSSNSTPVVVDAETEVPAPTGGARKNKLPKVTDEVAEQSTDVASEVAAN